MGLIFLFRRLVFAQVLLGIVAFCMAERNPGMLLVAGAIGALSWYVVEGPTGRPLPRWTINVGSIAAVAWLLFDLYWQKGDVIIAMGHFTMWLQILLLYAYKTNRDYAQILVLSLLQMIGASVLSVSMIYGILLAAYCILALFTVLTFQLKATSDLVMESNQAAAPRPDLVSRPSPVFGRGHRWQFRATAVGVGSVCAAIAIVIFIVLPRTSRFQPSAEIPKRLVPKQPGFSPQVQLNRGAPTGSGNREPVLNLTVKLHGENIGSSRKSWLLRGATCDRYDAYNHEWTRSLTSQSRDVTIDLPKEGLNLVALPENTPVLSAQITLVSTNQRALFSLHPVSAISAVNIEKIVFNPDDQQLFAGGNTNSALVYEVRSPLTVPPGLFADYAKTIHAPNRGPVVQSTPGRGLRVADASSYARGWNVQPERIRNLALEVIREAGLDRDVEVESDPRDEQIAQAIADYLRKFYSYSLSNPVTEKGQEPIIEFLFSHRKGHCELFASAMAALTRSIGMRARVVTGFHASEFNRIGGYYVVRPKHAHAWAEVDCGQTIGWKTFDATPSAAVAAEHKVTRTWFTSIRELYEHLEFAWINTVVAYDKETRDAVLGKVGKSIRHAATNQDSWLATALAWGRNMVDQWQFDAVTYTIMAIISVFIFIGLLTLARILVIRHRRLVALQLTRLPRKQRRALAKRLRFYLLMLDMLERHGYIRPAWQSPFGFAQELAEANPMRFDPVVALTELFYEIRFGHREMDNDRRTRIKAHLSQLEDNLAQRNA